MKSGYCTIMWNGRVHGPSKINPPPTMPKSSLLPKKVMLCIWWDWNGVLYCEVFLKNQTINSSKYCFLLDQLKTALDEYQYVSGWIVTDSIVVLAIHV